MERTLEQLETRQKKWAEQTLAQRANQFLSFARNLEQASALLQFRMGQEMGKPRAQARAEIEKSVAALKWTAENMERHLADSPGRQWQALGIVLAVMPWNYPVWQTVRALISSLPVGNVLLLKPSELTPATGNALSEIFQWDGEALLASLLMDHVQVADCLEDPRVAGVTLTGSSRAGAEVAARAGRNLKKQVLELGGADPYLVLADADVEMAARICAQARWVNSGQSCVAAKRFFIHEEIFDRFLELFRHEMFSVRSGVPEDPSTQQGPLAHRRFQKESFAKVQELRSEALNFWGAEPDWDQAGAFYPPQILQLSFPKRNSPLWSTEFFAPIACVWKVSSDEEALWAANHCAYALGAAVFSRSRAEKLALRLQAGLVGLNRSVVSSPEIPFGGMKESGYGKELGASGFFEFACQKVLLS